MEEQKNQGKETNIHDGISPIVIAEGEEKELFEKLWNYLVPPYGRAKTAQGEVIRIAGRVQQEFLGNGGVNWDENYKKMLHIFPEYLSLGNAFEEEDIFAAKALTNLLIIAGEEGRIEESLCEALCGCAAAWVQKNPEVIEPLEADYIR